ncbi:MAG: hypothetical protein HF310_16280 [Ignavibacteria bacterium]|jgi:hypothetical protein|nr:hypothetical protein [Ignavibacteria bacterium]
MKAVKILLLVLVTWFNASAQSGAFDSYNTSRFARVIRLGDAYTGVAKGLESMFYNTAGLAGINYYGAAFSNGHGIGVMLPNKVTPNDYAAVAPLPENLGTVGFSVNSLAFKYDGFFEESQTIYAVHYARKVIDKLSLGISADYYVDNNNSLLLHFGQLPKEVTGKAFDLSLSALYQFPEAVLLTPRDEFQIGVHFRNVLNTKMSYSETSAKDPLSQNIRTGLSYTFVPSIQKIYDLEPVRFMAAFDAVFYGADYKFNEWKPNYGLELTLLEILQLSFGRENELQINNLWDYSPQYPVNRYGFGINIPVNRILNLKNMLELDLNYSLSDWQKVDESNPPYYIEIQKKALINKDAFSMSVKFKL